MGLRFEKFDWSTPTKIFVSENLSLEDARNKVWGVLQLAHTLEFRYIQSFFQSLYIFWKVSGKECAQVLEAAQTEFRQKSRHHHLGNKGGPLPDTIVYCLTFWLYQCALKM